MSDRLRERFPLEQTSTVYMTGKSVYNFVRYGTPGIIASVELLPGDAEAIRKEFHKALAEVWAEGRDHGLDDLGATQAAIEFDELTNPYEGPEG